MAGQRDSALDDILWGVFQVSMVFFDAGRWKAIGHAWMVFLLRVLEEALLDDKLNSKQKLRRLLVVAYVSGRLVFY